MVDLARQEILCVAREESRPLLWEIVFEEDCLNRANLGADSAIYTLVRIDEVLLLIWIRMNAVDRTDFDARLILHCDAWFSDDVRHPRLLPSGGNSLAAGTAQPA